MLGTQFVLAVSVPAQVASTTVELGRPICEQLEGSSAMLEPIAPNVQRHEIRPGHWGQWLATGAAGVVGFVVLALLLILGSGIDQFDQRVLAAVVSVRDPNLTVFARAVTLVGSAQVVIWVGIAGALLLWLRTRRVLMPIALLAALAATASLVTIVKFTLNRPRPPVDLALGPPFMDAAFPSGHTTDGSVLVVLTASMLALTYRRQLMRRLLVIISCALALLIGWSRVYLGDHWPTDVLAGWLLAATMVSVTMALVNLALVPYLGGEMPDVLATDATRILEPTGSQRMSQPTA
jgi:membrane-associated phospholipid phosphatase